MSLAAFALFLQSRVDVHTGYAQLLPAFSIMGLGMGLTMSPMSTAGMNAVPPEKAGAASGILSMFRMIGGTFGVAAIGALFQSLARTRIDERLSSLHLPAGTREGIVDNLGSGAGSQMLHRMDPHQAAQVGSAMHDAFIHALGGALTLSAAVAAIGAVLALVLIEPMRKPARHADPARHAEAAEPLGAS
jgi:hypothetical protein